MKVKITFIILKKDNNISVTNDSHLKVYLDDEHLFPSKYISTKNEYDTLKEISEHHLNIDFDWIKKDRAKWSEHCSALSHEGTNGSTHDHGDDDLYANVA